MKNSAKFLTIAAAFFMGIVIVLLLPSHVSIQIQDSLLSNQINSPPIANAILISTPLTNVLAIPSNNIVSTSSYYFITFTPTQSNAIRTIEMTFPNGFDLTNATVLQEQFPTNVESFQISGQKITFVLASDAQTINYQYNVSIGGIINANTANNKISVVTKDGNGNITFGPTLSSVFNLSEIGTGMIDHGVVTTPKIADGAVTNAKIGFGAINSSQIIPGAVTTPRIASGAVTNAKIGFGAINSSQLMNGAVTTPKIENGAVTNAKIGFGAINSSQLMNGAVTSGKISSSFIKLVNLEPTLCQSGPVFIDGIYSWPTWCPSGVAVVPAAYNYFINDASVKARSVITVNENIPTATLGPTCGVIHLKPEHGFIIQCTDFQNTGSTTPVPKGTILNYAIMNP